MDGQRFPDDGQGCGADDSLLQGILGPNIQGKHMFLISFPRLFRAVAWGTMASFIAAQHVAIAGPHEEGIAAGQNANPAIRADITESSASGIVPGYTATPPERSLYGETDLSNRAESELAACAATPPNSMIHPTAARTRRRPVADSRRRPAQSRFFTK